MTPVLKIVATPAAVPHRLGATSEEVEHALGRKHQAISARFTDLRRMGLIDYAPDLRGIIKRDTVSGSGAAVHLITPLGRELVELGLPIARAGMDTTGSFHRGNTFSAQARANAEPSIPTQLLLVLRAIGDSTPAVLD